MKKTIVIIVLGLITVFCICFGTVRHLGGYKKVFNKGFHISLYDDDYEADDVEKGENGKYELNDKLEAFSSISIDARIMSISIEEGSDFAIEGTYNKSYLKPIINVNGNKLEVKQHEKKSNFNTGNQSCRITITVPSNTKLSRLDIDCNVGDVKLRGLTAKEIDIDTNVGEIDVREVDFDDIECDSNVGEVSVYPVKDLDNYNLSLSTDVGEVRVAGKSYKRSYNSHGNGSGQIRIDTNVGEIKVK